MYDGYTSSSMKLRIGSLLVCSTLLYHFAARKSILSRIDGRFASSSVSLFER